MMHTSRLLAAVSGDVAVAFIEIGLLALVLSLLARLGERLGLSAVPFYLLAGLGLGVADAVLNFAPGFVAGIVLDLSVIGSLLHLGRLGNRETPAVLNILVIEDLAMAVYLPVVAALIAGKDASQTAQTVAIALAAVAGVLWVAVRWGGHVSRHLAGGGDEALLLSVFGLTLLVAGLAQRLQISAAIGAFLVGLALSGAAQERASGLMEPLRDLFAGIFFLFFSFQIAPSELPAVAVPAVLLAVVTVFTKLGSGWIAAGRIGVEAPGRIRAGAALVARGEFSIVIASLGVALAEGPRLGTLVAAYVLLTAVIGPLAAKNADAISRRLVRTPAP